MKSRGFMDPGHERLVKPAEGLPARTQCPEFPLGQCSVGVDPVPNDEMPPDIGVPDWTERAEGYDAHETQTAGDIEEYATSH